jgi:ATP-binding cassette subfamily F protein 3
VQEINAAAPKMLPGETRDYLAKFLFSGDDHYKLVSQLSGGERGRLALACLALSGANLLLLDEPTNHLDLSSQDALQNVLLDFDGTILLVSHDRYLIDALATQIWDVEPDERLLKVFSGTYSQYSAFRRREKEESAAKLEPVKTGHGHAGQPEVKQKTVSQIRKHQDMMKKLESEISKLEQELDTLSRQLEDPPSDQMLVQKLGKAFNKLQEELDNRINEWETLSIDL